MKFGNETQFDSESAELRVQIMNGHPLQISKLNFKTYHSKFKAFGINILDNRFKSTAEIKLYALQLCLHSNSTGQHSRCDIINQNGVINSAWGSCGFSQ